jgi:hypothetical protein
MLDLIMQFFLNRIFFPFLPKMEKFFVRKYPKSLIWGVKFYFLEQINFF